MPRKRPDAWEHTTGTGRQLVHAKENRERGGTVYLWWRAGGNWRKKSLGVSVRGEDGAINQSVIPSIVAALNAQYQRLYGPDAAAALEEQAPAAKPALTLGATQRVLSDSARGLYPEQSPHRDEVFRELRFTVAALGSDTRWDAITASDWLALSRERLRALVRKQRPGAVVSTRKLVQHMLRIGTWLSQFGHLDRPPATPAGDWRDQILKDWRGMTGATRDPEPERPRYTLEEMRRLLVAAQQQDPRFGLLMMLGAELRLGQVVRSKRSDLDLEKHTFKVWGRGKKRGTTVDLTDGQLAAVRVALGGFLRPLEDAWLARHQDYHLFPAGRLLGRKAGAPRFGKGTRTDEHAGRQWILVNHRGAEHLAGIERRKGRATYGVRRIATDAVLQEGISLPALQQHGGWSSPDIPTSIYASRQSDAARAEAKEKRAAIRGELPSDIVTPASRGGSE